MENFGAILIVVGVFYLYEIIKKKEKEKVKKEIEQLKKEKLEQEEKNTKLAIKCINKIKENFDFECKNIDVMIFEEKIQSERYVTSQITEKFKISTVIIHMQWFDADDCVQSDRFYLSNYKTVEKRNMNEAFTINQEKKVVYKCYGEYDA